VAYSVFSATGLNPDSGNDRPDLRWSLTDTIEIPGKIPGTEILGRIFTTTTTTTTDTIEIPPTEILDRIFIEAIAKLPLLLVVYSELLILSLEAQPKKVNF
jgi:hypothetical protein